MSRTIPIGISDFQKLRENGYYYVDKSMLIADVINSGAEVTLLPRPRRFGKTINLSMLRYFFDSGGQDGTGLFNNLKISDHAQLMQHQGAYPTLFLTLKDVKYSTYEDFFRAMADIIGQLFLDHGELLVEARPVGIEKRKVEAIRQGTAGNVDLQGALALLTKLLHRSTGQKVIVLIDEYDAPIHAGFLNGYYAEIIEFMRNFLSGAFKDNAHLQKGVVTGILRVANESIFSGFNNPRVCTLLDEAFSHHFGFTETEMEKILADFNLQHKQAEVRDWYNGYRFGSQTIYNPWSIMQYVNEAADSGKRPEAYWINTSDNHLIGDLITDQNAVQPEELKCLLAGGTVDKEIDTNIVLNRLQSKSVWSMLTLSGYLKVVSNRLDADRVLHQLAIPNREVRSFFDGTVRDWLEDRVGGRGLDPLRDALLNEDMKLFGAHLAALVKGVLSFHDTAGAEPERVYHAFVLGMLVNLRGRYRVSSNRESGFGRYDLCLTPLDPNATGFIFEFKRSDELSPADTAKAALHQIVDRQYATEMRAAGIARIRAIGVAIDGKRAHVETRLL